MDVIEWHGVGSIPYGPFEAIFEESEQPQLSLTMRYMITKELADRITAAGVEVFQREVNRQWEMRYRWPRRR